jgi:Acetyltransferase (GNAT) domain
MDHVGENAELHYQHRGLSRGARSAEARPLTALPALDQRPWHDAHAGAPPLPLTSEKEQEWYDRETLRPIGNTGPRSVDHRNRTATFGILIGEPECGGKGYGTESTRLMLDYAFTVLGLHNVMLTGLESNPAAGTGFRFCQWALTLHRLTSPDHHTVPGSHASAEACIPCGVLLGAARRVLRAWLLRSTPAM